MHPVDEGGGGKEKGEGGKVLVGEAGDKQVRGEGDGASEEVVLGDIP